MSLRSRSIDAGDAEFVEINPLFTRPGEHSTLPRYAIGADVLLPSTAYQIVHDEAMLDGNARTTGFTH